MSRVFPNWTANNFQESDMTKSSVTIRQTRSGTTIRARGKSANALFNAMTRDPQKEADDWNAKVNVGDQVEYRSDPYAEPQVFATRTEASVLSGHTAVVWLEGKAGCVAIEACKPIQAA